MEIKVPHSKTFLQTSFYSLRKGYGRGYMKKSGLENPYNRLPDKKSPVLALAKEMILDEL